MEHQLDATITVLLILKSNKTVIVASSWCSMFTLSTLMMHGQTQIKYGIKFGAFFLVHFRFRCSFTGSFLRRVAEASKLWCSCVFDYRFLSNFFFQRHVLYRTVAVQHKEPFYPHVSFCLRANLCCRKYA
jgi:hypothetical protein